MSRFGKPHQPPLFFFGCLLVGWGMGFLHPLAMGLSLAIRVGMSLLLLLLAVGCGGWGLHTFRRSGTTPDPNGTASALLTSGPFRFSRNPLYLALSATLASLALLLDSAWVLGMVPVLVLLLDRLVIAREEAQLRNLFGDDYAAYMERVRRWF